MGLGAEQGKEVLALVYVRRLFIGQMQVVMALHHPAYTLARLHQVGLSYLVVPGPTGPRSASELTARKGRLICFIIDVYVNVKREMATTYSISDLAKEFDLTTRAIRFYEDMGLLQPERSGPGGRSRVYSGRDRTRLKLTLRAKRLGLSLTEAKDIIDMYDSPRDTGPQLEKFLAVIADHQKQLEAQMVDLQANLDELKVHQREARALLAKSTTKSAVKKTDAKERCDHVQ